jgi:hypothetical protein
MTMLVRDLNKTTIKSTLHLINNLHPRAPQLTAAQLIIKASFFIPVA